ncbi:MAG: hypothetical protein MZW92_49035 [Comamonadaceae bacterium]|nr:hypothetical protein [Comamonadaceae bacterium]
MQLVDVEVGAPGPGEIRIRHHACGLNFIDVYQRTGLYPNPLPLRAGHGGRRRRRGGGRGRHAPAGRATAPPMPATRRAPTARCA